MVDGGRGEADGGWWMAAGEVRRVADGGWQRREGVAGEVRRMADGRWRER